MQRLLNRTDAAQLALLWCGTPYVTAGRLLGIGCDCATLLSEYLIGIGAVREIPLFTYAQDWFCHTTEEKYFDELSKYATCVEEGRCFGKPREAQMGNIALFRVAGSKLYNHGAILTGWPYAVHAFDKDGVTRSRPAIHPLTTHAEMAIFDPWEMRC